MLIRLLLILCVTGHVFTKEPPDVDCLVIHLKHVRCSWTSDLNYTFSSHFLRSEDTECATYLSKNGINSGCVQPYDNLMDSRFTTFVARLSHGNRSFKHSFLLKQKVVLQPPVNVTVKNGSDFNLWFYWNQTSHCVENEVEHTVNGKNRETSLVQQGYQSYCINLPSSSSRYELRVRSRIESNCAESLFWSDWSEPAVWGNITDSKQPAPPVWTPLLYGLGAITLVVIVMLLLPHGRNRFLPLPIPKPALVLYDIEDWLQISKGLKGNLNYNEPACPVSECRPASESDCSSSSSSSSSSSTDGSASTVTTDQTRCSVTIPGDKSQDRATSCSSSAGLLSSQEEEEEEEEEVEEEEEEEEEVEEEEVEEEEEEEEVEEEEEEVEKEEMEEEVVCV